MIDQKYSDPHAGLAALRFSFVPHGRDGNCMVHYKI